MPNHYGGDLLHTMAMSGLSRVRTELLHFLVVPAAAPHPVQLIANFRAIATLAILRPRRMAGERTGCGIADRCALSPARLPPARFSDETSSYSLILLFASITPMAAES